MLPRVSAAVLSICLVSSLTIAAQGQQRTEGKVQAFVLEVNIVEVTELQRDDIEKIEKSVEQLTRLTSEGKAKLVASLRVRTRAGEGFSARIGQRIPIQTGGLPAYRPADGSGPGAANSPQVAVPQLQYENTGLSVDGNSVAVGDGMLDIKFKLEMSGLDRSTGRLTPTFIQRTLSDVIRMKEGETAIPMGLIQQEPPWAPPGQGSSSANPAKGGFIILLTTKPVQ